MKQRFDAKNTYTQSIPSYILQIEYMGDGRLNLFSIRRLGPHSENSPPPPKRLRFQFINSCVYNTQSGFWPRQQIHVAQYSSRLNTEFIAASHTHLVIRHGIVRVENEGTGRGRRQTDRRRHTADNSLASSLLSSRVPTMSHEGGKVGGAAKASFTNAVPWAIRIVDSLYTNENSIK